MGRLELTILEKREPLDFLQRSWLIDCRDLLRLKHGGALQFSEALTSQFDKMATCRRRVLKVVVHRVDDTQVRLKRPGIDRACFEEVAQVGHDCL